eukprot:c22955_g1_i1 orf=720-1724(-)
MAEGQQHLKKAAALAFDYESDPRWAEYCTNVFVPTHLSSKPEVSRYLKFKFYKRYIDPELQVEPLSSLPSRNTGGVASSSSTSEQRRTANSGTRSGAQNFSGTRDGSLRLDQQSFIFLANAWVVVMSTMAFFPFVPHALSDRLYRFSFLGTVMSCGHSIYLQHGRPQTWNLQAIQVWLQSLVAGKDFLYLLFSLVFISAFVPIKFAVIPVICRSLEYVARYLRRNFSGAQLYRKYLGGPCNWLENNNATLHNLSANSEIGLGFLLFVLLLTPQRNLIQFFVYWQLLKLMYHSPATAPYHRNTWSRIGMTANPLIQRYLPILQTPIGFAKRWFHN